MKWALAIKARLGNVYHVVGEPQRQVARCDRRLRLDDKQYETPPDDGYQCQRCRALATLDAQRDRG